ncbi:MAG: hypothetical protein ACM3U2_13465 [Deltaproteobacteria bacterium]
MSFPIPMRGCRLLIFLSAAFALAFGGCTKSEGTTVGGAGTASASAKSKAKSKKSAKPREKADAEPSSPSETAPVDKESAGADPPQRVVRPTLKPPAHDDDRLAELGIYRYESKHLVLYTDIDPDLARPLPKLMDEAYTAWEDYFGPLPPDSAGTDFQMVGYIMADTGRFRAAKLFGDDSQILLEGVFRDQLFWMKDQRDDYWRRHLMLHEGTHCFMSAFPNPTNQFRWYMEGMAELFRAHQTDAGGKTRFRVFPTDNESFGGLGWLRLIDEDLHAAGPLTIEEVVGQASADFEKYNAYAWSWALCAFLDGHPRYRDRFRRLGTLVTGRRDARFELEQVYHEAWPDLCEEWLVFAGNVCYGYDIERTVIDLHPGKPLGGQGDKVKLEIGPDRGWQTSGILLEKDRTYKLSAIGRSVVADDPRPWESEPQGISFRYHAGLPVGMLVAVIRGTELHEKAPHTTMLEVLPVGRECLLTPRITGTLYFRVNDFWNELADNTGSYQVTIKEPTGE